MKKRSRWILWGILGSVGILTAALIVVLWAASSSGLPDDALYVPRDVSSLQEAVDHASPGATIVVQASAGQIAGPILIAVSDITLISSGGRAILNGIGSEPALSIRASGVIVRGFDITSESIGLQINASDCTIEDLHIEATSIGIQLNNASRCFLKSIETNAGRIGVELIGSSSVTVDALTVVGSSEYGVRLLGSRNNLLKDLSISGNAVGISIEEASADNLIEASDINLSSVAGIEIRDSNDNALIGNTLDSVRIGIVLERVTGTEISSCEIRGTVVAGISLQQAVQNRISETHVDGSQAAGIQLVQSAENSLLYNDISECLDRGISLTSSSKNLIMGNGIEDCSIGIQIERSDDTRVLRNRVSNSESCSFLVSQGSFNRLLDNVSIDGFYGMILVESGSNTLMRNSIEGAARAGLLLVSTHGENYVSENEARTSTWGLLLAASARDLITYNELVDNEVGVLLSQLGGGTRIEGNTIADNGIGLQQQTDLAELGGDLETLGIVLPENTGSTVPILTNNVFRDNADYDILNRSMVHLLAAGNWWGAASIRDSGDAVVSDGVSLKQSAWKGTIAVGTGSDNVRVLLGRILQMTLAEEGFRVVDLIGMGPSEHVHQALLNADVDLIWWSGSTSDSLDAIEGSLSVVVPTPALEGWRIIVSSQLAGQLTELTASGLADWCNETNERLRYTATSALEEEEFEAFLAAYKLDESVLSFTQAEVLEEVEALLKFGAIDVAIVGSLEETLTLSGFLAIEDTLQVLEQDSISMIVQQSIVASYPEAQDILEELGERLTSEVLQGLVSRIRSLHKDPEEVAREFLRQ